ncbi:MAG TPA: LysR family transcriptional regulator [Solirubrobacteraceae bacterium]|nr:LysR family transcriptional regulator [Solirubrobacteraceae bacterium]
MEMRQLSYFLAVADERHFTRAAARVHLTQSSLSSSVRALERELGSDLFVRSTRQVELTEAGRALLPAARRALAAAEDARDAVAAVRGLVRGHLAIGAIQALGHVNLPELLARFHRTHPAVTLRLHHVGASELVRGTADGEIDLAIVDPPLGPQRDRVRATTIATELLQLAVASDGPLAHRSRVRLGDLADHEFIEYRPDSALRASIDRACHAVGLRRQIACEVDALPELVELVALGLGVAMLPSAAIRMAGGRATGIATDPAIPRDLLLVTPLDREPSPAGEAFLRLLGHNPSTKDAVDPRFS